MLCEMGATQVVEWRSTGERWLLSFADSDWVCCFDEAWLSSAVAIADGRRGKVN